MRLKTTFLWFALVCVCGVTQSALAQDVPESAKSGVVEQSVNIPPSPAAIPPKSIFEQLEYPKTDLLMDEGIEITVKSFDFSGNTIFSNSTLKGFLQAFMDKPLHFKELQQALGVINANYREKGFFLARAVLPAQDITSGVVRIQVIEGQLGEVIVEGGKFYKSDFVKKQFACSVNGVINYHLLLKSLVLLNEYPDLQVKAVMQKGKAPLTADVVLKVEDKRPVHFSLDANNFGSRYVSTYRTGMQMEYSNLILGGDKIVLREVSGAPIHNLGYASVGYSAPLNAYGTRAGVSYAWSQFDVQKEFRQLDAGGGSQIVSFDVTHPLIRTLTSALDAYVGLDIKNAKNYLLGEINSKDKLRVLRAGLSGDRLDTVFHGRDFMNVSISEGLGDLWDGSKRNDARSSRIGAGGEFVKGNLELARYQQLPWETVIMLKATTQIVDDAVPVGEQIAIGGANTVRGFPEAEHVGDYGTILNLELTAPPIGGATKVPFLKKDLKDVMRLIGFLDYGSVYLKNAQAGESKNYEIAGAGFGLRFDFGNDLNVKVDLGFPVGGQESSSGDNSVTYLQVLKKF